MPFCSLICHLFFHSRQYTFADGLWVMSLLYALPHVDDYKHLVLWLLLMYNCPNASVYQHCTYSQSNAGECSLFSKTANKHLSLLKTTVDYFVWHACGYISSLSNKIINKVVSRADSKKTKGCTLSKSISTLKRHICTQTWYILGPYTE